MRHTGVVRTYGQYCPIARGAEIFAERWTPLIIRNLYLGCGSFSEILEGGRIQLDGAPSLVRAFPTWNARSMFAHIRPVSPTRHEYRRLNARMRKAALQEVREWCLERPRRARA